MYDGTYVGNVLQIKLKYNFSTKIINNLNMIKLK